MPHAIVRARVASATKVVRATLELLGASAPAGVTQAVCVRSVLPSSLPFVPLGSWERGFDRRNET
jgi:hypothetical protein